MEPRLPHGTIAVFRKVKRVKRGDIALVEHPELGWIVRSVAAVSFSGRVALQSTMRSAGSSQRAGMVSPECVKGRLVFRILGSSLLPTFGRTDKAPVSRGAREP